MRTFAGFLFIVIIAGAFGQLTTQTQQPFFNGVSSGFSPFLVPGMMIYVDATTLVTNASDVSPPANNDVVKSMGDLSGHGWHLFKRATLSTPFYSTTRGPDGGGCIMFSNTPVTTVALTNAMSGVVMAQPYVVFLVFCIPTVTTGAGILNGYADQNMQITESGTLHMFAGTDRDTGYANVSQPSGTFLWFVETFMYNGASSFTRTNGVAGSSLGGSVGTGNASGVTLGNVFNYSSGFSVLWFRSLLIYTNLTDTTTIHNIEKYLGAKNGITVL